MKEGAEELAGCVPLHHLTDNASLATMLLETYKVSTSVADPWHFDVDPDPRIHASY